MRQIFINNERWDYARVFRISRESRTASHLIRVDIIEDGLIGRGECCPYPRYQETIESVSRELLDISLDLMSTNDMRAVWRRIPAGAAQNALDCALLDIEAQKVGRDVAELLGVSRSQSSVTAQTIVIDGAHSMGEEAARLAGAPLLKVKLDKDNIVGRLEAIRRVAPDAQLIVDANEGWTIDILTHHEADFVRLGVSLIEQPLAENKDAELADLRYKVPLCADESCHTINDLRSLRPKYQAINIKLDKTGGLINALRLAREAKAMDFKIMVGCMVGTSLAMAPASLLSSFADFIDLDGPLFLKKDRPVPIQYENGRMTMPAAGLWGHGR